MGSKQNSFKAGSTAFSKIAYEMCVFPTHKKTNYKRIQLAKSYFLKLKSQDTVTRVEVTWLDALAPKVVL